MAKYGRRGLWIAVTLVVSLLTLGATTAFLIIGFRLIYANQPESTPQPQGALAPLQSPRNEATASPNEEPDKVEEQDSAGISTLRATDATRGKQPTWQLQETDLAKREHIVPLHIGFVPSPDYRHLAYVHESAIHGKKAVAVDGVSGKEYDFINGLPIFSPDGKHIAYVAQSGRDSGPGVRVVVDGKEGKLYERIEQSILFSPDSRRVAYVAVPMGGEERFMHATATGTAFVVSADGFLLTCAHLVHDAGSVNVALRGGTHSATVVEEDPTLDLALLKVDLRELPVLPLGEGQDVELGMDVRVFGFPLASLLGDNLSTTRGTLSGFPNRENRRIFQVDAAINAGNSGGPLVNERGEAIGIVNQKLAGPAVSNIGMAIPIDQAAAMLRKHHVKLAAKPNKAPESSLALVRQVKPAVGFVSARIRVGGPFPTTNKFIVVAGEQEYGPSAVLFPPKPVFSPDGKLVWAAPVATQFPACVVIDGKPGPTYAEISMNSPKWLSFSADGKRMAYFVREGHGMGVLRLVLDGQPREALLDGISNNVSAILSPDGKRVAYSGWSQHRVPHRTVVVVDGKQCGTGFDLVEESIAFSPDSRRVAFVGIRGWQKIVVVDGVEEKPSEGPISALVFSPNSKHLAYRLGSWGPVVVDGKPEKESAAAPESNSPPNLNNPGWQLPVFSPDSKHLAYVGSIGAVVRDGVPEKKYNEIWGLTFSPDSQHLAYLALRRNPSSPPSDAGPNRPWEPGEFEWVVVRDGVEGKGYREILRTTDGRCLFFSPDGRHLAYAAREEILRKVRGASAMSHFYLVVDTLESKRFHEAPRLPLLFDGPDALHTLVGTRRVELKIAD